MDRRGRGRRRRLGCRLIPTLSYFDDPFTKFLIGAASAAVTLLLEVAFHRPILFYLRFVLKSLFRNPLRTGLTAAATMLLVFIVTLVWTVLWFLHMVTAEKSKDLKAIVTERWQLPSQMPFSYGAELADGRRDPTTRRTSSRRTP